MKWPSLLESGNNKAINSTISVWIRAWSPLFSSNQNSLLLTNRENWDNRENVLKDAKSIFQRLFHGRRRFRIVSSLITKLRRRQQRKRQKSNRFNEQNNNSARASRFWCTFLCSFCITKKWNDQILSLLGNRNGKAINSTISVRTWAWSLLLSSNLNSLLLSKRAP